MSDLRTTITGAVTGILALMAHYGVVIPEDWQTAIVSVGVALGFYFAKDGKLLK